MENIFLSLFLSFIMGGILCSAAQILIDKTSMTPAKILVFYVCLGVMIYALGIYDTLFEIFGCGISVPLIGFGANIGRGVFEAISEEGFFGILSGGISAAAEGITLSLFLGLLFSLTSKAKSRRM